MSARSAMSTRSPLWQDNFVSHTMPAKHFIALVVNFNVQGF
jgi:hypothetical protein